MLDWPATVSIIVLLTLGSFFVALMFYLTRK